MSLLSSLFGHQNVSAAKSVDDLMKSLDDSDTDVCVGALEELLKSGKSGKKALSSAMTGSVSNVSDFVASAQSLATCIRHTCQNSEDIPRQLRSGDSVKEAADICEATFYKIGPNLPATQLAIVASFYTLLRKHYIAHEKAVLKSLKSGTISASYREAIKAMRQNSAQIDGLVSYLQDIIKT